MKPAIYIAVFGIWWQFVVTIVQLLFESEVLDNRSIQEALLSHNAHKFKGTVVLDGGSILYTINCRKGNTLETLARLVSTWSLWIQITCSRSVKSRRSLTKDSTHLHRTQKTCTVLDLTKLQFLFNSANKQSFVDYLAFKLANIPGIENVKSRDDADCLIINTALSAAANYTCDVSPWLETIRIL